MRIDLNDPLVFEKWRELYHEMTNEEHIEFCNAAEAVWPTQKHFNAGNFEMLFEHCSRERVLEIGGWKGELAQHCLSKYNLESWHNIELCEAAAKKTVHMGSLPYTVECPKRIDWFAEEREFDYDVCVSAHTIEHLSDEHLRQLLNYINGIPIIMLEAPIGQGESDWRGYCGTHILKMGWERINAIMLLKGYSVQEINPTCYIYQLWKPK